MTTNPKYSYLNPTYSAYYWYFNQPRTLLCFSLRQSICILTIIDIIYSSIALCFGLTYIIIDQISQFKLFQSNELIQNLLHVHIGIFFIKRILFRSSWTISILSQYFPMIFYLHIISNGLTLLCSINMFTAIKYFKPYRASIYFIHEAAYFVHTTAIFIRWFVDHEKERNSINLLYGKGDLGFFSADTNIFCLALLECLWKMCTLIIILRSIQCIQNYCLDKEFNSTKPVIDDKQSSTFLVIHVAPDNTFLTK